MEVSNGAAMANLKCACMEKTNVSSYMSPQDTCINLRHKPQKYTQTNEYKINKDD